MTFISVYLSAICVTYRCHSNCFRCMRVASNIDQTRAVLENSCDNTYPMLTSGMMDTISITFGLFFLSNYVTHLLDRYAALKCIQI